MFENIHVEESAKIFQEAELCTIWHLWVEIFTFIEKAMERTNWI